MRIILILIFLSTCCTAKVSAEESLPFKGRVNSNDINIRADSTVSSEKICSVNKNDCLEVTAELYGWYKIKLPKHAPAFVQIGLLEPLDSQTAKTSKKNVNIRLRPSESSPVIGKAKKDEIVRIFENRNGWYRIEPTGNSFGWINRSFVNKIEARD